MMMFRLNLCFYFFIICASFVARFQSQTIVSVESGQIRGILLMSPDRRQYSAFLGIPYAQPPRRFEYPERVGRWNGVRDTTRFQPSCPHMHRTFNRVVGNEDCLYLNVYTPSLDLGNAFNLVSYPVILFIHGPDYTSGSGNIYGAERLIDKGNVVVTFNYRLGSLGFLSTGDNESPGNNGLHDQNLAIQWVKRNINQFRGDPNNIALVGQGAGAASVSLHMMSPLSKGLFQRAVTESGNALCPWAVDNVPKTASAENAQKLGRLLSCGTGYIDTNFLVRCLKNRLVTDLIKNQEKLKGFGTFPGLWKPVVDVNQNNKSRVFLPDTPKMMVTRGDLTGRDLLTGINKDEGSMLYFYLLKFMPNIAVDSFFLQNYLLPNFLGNLTNLYGSAVVRQVYTKYFDGVNSRQPTEVIRGFTKMATDALFVGCNEEWAKVHSKSSVFNRNDPNGNTNTYMYLFTYDGENSFVDREADAIGVGMSKLFETGVSDGDELIYLWNLPSLNFTRFSLFDQAISNRMTTLWSQFVASGIPVQFPDGEYKPWPRLSTTSNSYYDIGRDLSDRSSYRLVESQLWNEELPKMSTLPPTRPFPTNFPVSEPRTKGEESQRYKTATWAMLAIIIALVILCIFLCCLLISSKRKREFKAEPDVYH